MIVGLNVRYKLKNNSYLISIHIIFKVIVQIYKCENLLSLYFVQKGIQ
jgi:hypothetical protein